MELDGGSLLLVDMVGRPSSIDTHPAQAAKAKLTTIATGSRRICQLSPMLRTLTAASLSSLVY